MAGEPNDTPAEKQQPTTLNYATRVGAYPEPQVHPRFVVLLIGLTALAGIWSIILGLSCLGDAWLFGLLLIGAGICLCWATIGKLSANGMRLRAALILLVLGIAMDIPVIAISHRLFVQQRILYARELAAVQSDYRHLPTEAESQVFGYEMIRNNALASGALGACTGAYAATLLARRRGNDFS